MPLTPKGYCDNFSVTANVTDAEERAEMPLTPKGYCDNVPVFPELVMYLPGQKCP